MWSTDTFYGRGFFPRAAALLLMLVGCAELAPRSVQFDLPGTVSVGSELPLDVEVLNSRDQPIPARMTFSVEPATLASATQGHFRCLREGKGRLTVTAGEVSRFEVFECIDPLDREAKAYLRSLFTCEVSFFQEKDTYSADLAEIGFSPEGCADGSRPAAPTMRWAASCHFAYTVVLEGDCPLCGFTAYARGLPPDAEGRDFILAGRGGTPVGERGVPHRIEPRSGMRVPVQ